MTTFTWTGTGSDDDWSNAGNWTPSGGPPGALDNADIAIAATINAGSGANHATVADADFSDDDFLNGTLQTTVSLTVAGDAASLMVNAGAALQASNVDPGTASLSIDNNGQVDDTGQINETLGGVEVGSAGYGTLSIYDDGVATFDNTTNAALILGQSVNGNGNVYVTGAGSTLTINDSGVIDGYAGQGALDVFTGGLVTVDDGISLGSQADSDGQIFVDFDNAEISVTAGAFDVGVGGLGGVTIGNGGLVDDQSSLGVDVGSLKGSSGTLNDSGDFTVANGVVVGDGGQGGLEVESGGAATIGSLDIAAQAGSIGTVTAANTGSTLDAKAVVIGGTPTAAGGAGSLTANTGGSVDVQSVLMWNGTINVDSQSLVSIGAGLATVTTGVDVQSGAFLSGYGSITGSVTNNGEITASAGVLKLDDAVSGGGSERIDTGATLAFASSVTAGQTVFFASGGGSNWGSLDLSGEGTGLTFAAPISGFAGADGTASTSDVIEVAGSGGTDHVAWTQNTASQGTLQVENSSDGVLETLTLDGSYNQNQFTMADPAAVGQITYTACYARGTRILVDRGEIAVEDLRIGDLAVTPSGGLRPVVWLGHRRIDISRHRDPAAVRPVRVSGNAFGEGLPRRDLWLSPGHNVASEGALMPISCLINGRSVAQINQETVEYWHVELDAHDILLAEGLAAESYLDCGNRTAFANGGAFVEAHPDFRSKHWAATCLPLVSGGPEVARTKARLLARLAEEGQRIDHEADAHIVVDGVRIEPIRLSEWRLAFTLPAGSREIALRSNVFVPAHTVPESGDSRELGLCVGRLRIDGSPVALDSDQGCASGWREAECADGRFIHRWTTGATPLAAGARVVIVDLAGVGYSWRKPERRGLALSA